MLIVYFTRAIRQGTETLADREKLNIMDIVLYMFCYMRPFEHWPSFTGFGASGITHIFDCIYTFHIEH